MALTRLWNPPELPIEDPLSEQVQALRVRRSAVIGGVAGLAFAIFNLLTPGQALLGQIELASVVLMILPSIYLSFQDGRRVHAENLLLIGAFVVFFALLVLGGVEGTGLLWVFVIPFLAFFLKGPVGGALTSFAFLGLCVLYFVAEARNAVSGYAYPLEVQVQFLLAQVFYTVVAVMFNWTQIRQDLGLRQANLAARRANQALEASRAQFQFIADNAPVYIAQYDRNQHYRFANKALVNLFGRSSTDVQGKHVRDVVGEAVYREIGPYLARALAGEIVEAEVPVPTASGLRAMLARYAPERDATGNVVGLVVATVDITELKAANESLQQAATLMAESNQNISRILATASHDLRQPVHALGLLLGSVRPTDAPEPVAKALVDAQTSAKALRDMLDAYFDYSWALARSEQSQPKALHLPAVFDELQGWFQEKARQDKVKLVVRTPDLWVVSDALLLRRVLLNLLSNAIRFSPKGTVMMCCRPGSHRGELRIQVRDNGVGIDPRHHEKIFQEFYQAPESAAHSVEGLGLGLSVVRQICQRLKIPVQMRSALQSGTCFTLRLPCGSAPLVQPAATPSDFGADADRPRRILLIEDDPISLQAQVALLQNWGHVVTPCASVSQALSQMDPHQPPELLLTDFQLKPGPDGLEGVRLIRAQLGADLPACLITADGNASLAQQARDLGVGFLQKPVAPSKLRSWLRRQQAALTEPET